MLRGQNRPDKGGFKLMSKPLYMCHVSVPGSCSGRPPQDDCTPGRAQAAGSLPTVAVAGRRFNSLQFWPFHVA